MAKVEVDYKEFLPETIRVMGEQGLLLASASKSGKANAMAIGWGVLGLIWGKPMFLVLVRPSRHTFALIEESGEFTVNVPAPGMQEIVSYFGTVSGRDHDKFREKHLTPSKAKVLSVPIIEECLIHYECRVVHKNDIIPAELRGEINGTFYGSRDYHRVFFGEVLATRADEDAGAKLG